MNQSLVKMARFLVSLALAGLLFSCAGSYYSRGNAAMKKGDLDAAISNFYAAAKKNPSDFRVFRELGVAFYHQGKDPRHRKLARAALEKAYSLNPADGTTLFYLGALAEENGDLQTAIDYYRQYTRIGRMSKMRGLLKARLRKAVEKQVAQEAKLALQRESQLVPARIPANSLAVLYFKNLSRNRNLDPLQKGLAEMIITDLSQVRGLSVVERIRLQKMLEEIGLGQSGVVDPKTAPRLGKLLGARKLVHGSFLVLGNNDLRLDAGMVDAFSGKSSKPDELSGNLQRLFRLEKNLVFKVIKQMGVRLTDQEREAILRVPTENLLAFMAYSRGLDYEDRGMLSQARAAFSEAVKLDPNFTLAKDDLNAVEFLQKPDATPEMAEQTEGAGETTGEGATLASQTTERLIETAGNVSSGFLPSIDSRKPVEEQSRPSFGSGADIEVLVPLPQVP